MLKSALGMAFRLAGVSSVTLHQVIQSELGEQQLPSMVYLRQYSQHSGISWETTVLLTQTRHKLMDGSLSHTITNHPCTATIHIHTACMCVIEQYLELGPVLALLPSAPIVHH